MFSGPAAAGAVWPNGARAAVSLTYDDGYDSQLDLAVPDLDALGLKATFFLTMNNLGDRLPDWIALSRQGHEIGDHTMTHPCRLNGYTLDRFLREEVQPAEQFLDTNFGGPSPRTFAYTCGFERLGRGSNLVRERRYQQALHPTFVAARSVSGPPNDPASVLDQRFFLNGFEPTYDADATQPAFDYVRRAVARGHWAILVFHEVLPERKGEGDTSRAVHRAILDYIAGQPVWCAPMRTVFRHVTGI